MARKCRIPKIAFVNKSPPEHGLKQAPIYLIGVRSRLRNKFMLANDFHHRRGRNSGRTHGIRNGVIPREIINNDIGIQLASRSGQALKTFRQECVISVENGDPFPARHTKASISGSCRTAILRKEQQAHARVGQTEFPGHLCGVVRGTIVDDKHLQRWPCLIQSGVNRSMQEGAGIVGGDQHSDAIV